MNGDHMPKIPEHAKMRAFHDTFLYLTLLASRYDIDLADAIRQKFNEKSIAMGFPERLP